MCEPSRRIRPENTRRSASKSLHLQQLRRAGLVTTRREGKYVLYELADEEIVTLVSSLQRVAERNLAEVQQILNLYFHQRDSLEPVASKELMQRLHEGAVILLDVRPGDEFAQGHLPGAINIPLTDLEENVKTLPRNREIIAYCRGPFCLLSFEAVARLRDRGLAARRLETGFPEWKVAGLPVE